MKKVSLLFSSLCFAFLLMAVYSFRPAQSQLQNSLNGAWRQTEDGHENVLLFMDGYATQTIYSKAKKQFVLTRGGTYTTGNGTLTITFEFDTQNKDLVGQTVNGKYKLEGKELEITLGNDTDEWERVDEGQAPLAGVWRITHRMQNDKLEAIHQTGPRKTLKILTGNRFQWAAINPETKEFSGTGGGTYTFANGKYTENIEFFSRDSSRVGASLVFDDKLEGGAWHHTGLSSRGDKIYEVWGRIKQNASKTF